MEGAHSWKGVSILVRRWWRQEFIGHAASSGGKQKGMDAHAD